MRKLNQKGQILIFVTLGFVLLGLFVGMAVDFGRGYLERARVSRTVDAVALAAAKALAGSSDPVFEGAAVTAGCGAAAMNGITSSSCGETSPVGGGQVGCVPGAGGFDVSLCFVTRVTGGASVNYVQVSGRSSVPTTFLRLLTFVGAGDYSTLPVAAVAEGGPERPVDLMLILDRSGSMSGTDPSGITKITALRCALTGSNCPGGSGSTTGFLGQGFTNNDKIGMTSFSNRGCGTGGTNDSTSPLNPCPPDVALNWFDSGQETTLRNRINGLGASGFTQTMEALRAAWGPMNTAFLDTTRSSRKAVLLVTDGQPTAIRLSSIAACEQDPVNYPNSGPPLGGSPWTDSNGCYFRYTGLGNGLSRFFLNNSSAGNFLGATLYKNLLAATRNAARDEGNSLRNLGGGNLIVFVIAIGEPDTGQPTWSLDANARCLLGLIANDQAIINDPSTNQNTGSCAAIHTTSDGDTHNDLNNTTPGGTPRAFNTTQLQGKLFTVNLNQPVTPQLQQIFAEIASLLKLRLTV